jgi:hypothetical protein
MLSTLDGAPARLDLAYAALIHIVGKRLRGSYLSSAEETLTRFNSCRVGVCSTELWPAGDAVLDAIEPRTLDHQLNSWVTGWQLGTDVVKLLADVAWHSDPKYNATRCGALTEADGSGGLPQRGALPHLTQGVNDLNTTLTTRCEPPALADYSFMPVPYSLNSYDLIGMEASPGMCPIGMGCRRTLEHSKHPTEDTCDAIDEVASVGTERVSDAWEALLWKRSAAQMNVLRYNGTALDFMKGKDYAVVGFAGRGTSVQQAVLDLAANLGPDYPVALFCGDAASGYFGVGPSADAVVVVTAFPGLPLQTHRYTGDLNDARGLLDWAHAAKRSPTS